MYQNMKHSENLTNNNFKVLAYLYDKADRTNCVRITQGEIAKDLDLTRSTIGLIIKSLREFGYMKTDEEILTKHYLTETGIKVVETYRSAED